jgi:DNA processing protein
VGDEFSAGCNNLIQQGKAVMIQSGSDIKEWMRWEGQSNLLGQFGLMKNVSPEESMILRCLEDVSSLHLDELVYRSGLGLFEVKAALLNLEMEKGVRSFPGGRWGKG